MFIICSEYQEFEKAVGFLERDTEIIQGMSTISSKLMGFISADVLLSYLILFGFFFPQLPFRCAICLFPVIFIWDTVEKSMIQEYMRA